MQTLTLQLPLQAKNDKDKPEAAPMRKSQQQTEWHTQPPGPVSTQRKACSFNATWERGCKGEPPQEERLVGNPWPCQEPLWSPAPPPHHQYKLPKAHDLKTQTWSKVKKCYKRRMTKRAIGRLILGQICPNLDPSQDLNLGEREKISDRKLKQENISKQKKGTLPARRNCSNPPPPNLPPTQGKYHSLSTT